MWRQITGITTKELHEIGTGAQGILMVQVEATEIDSTVTDM